MLHQFEACRAGLGLAALPCFLCDPLPELTRVVPPPPDPQTGLWLLTHPDLRRTARVRALLDVLYEALRPLAPRFEGRGGEG